MSSFAVVIVFWAGWFFAASPDGGRYLPSAADPAGSLVIVALALAHVLAGVLIGRRWWLLPLLAIAPVATAVPFNDQWPLMVVYIAPVWLLVTMGIGLRGYIDAVRSP